MVLVGQTFDPLTALPHSQNNPTIRQISPRALQNLRTLETVDVIDVRSTDEFRAAHIEGAKSIPADILAIDQLTAPTKTIVLQCASGVRSENAAWDLQKQAPHLDIYTLEGGLQAWELEGLPVIKSACAESLPIMRQVQITAGLLIVAGVAMTYFISFFLIMLPLLIGCGLVFAGITGWCGMAKLLMMMPWNP